MQNNDILEIDWIRHKHVDGILALDRGRSLGERWSAKKFSSIAAGKETCLTGMVATIPFPADGSDENFLVVGYFIYEIHKNRFSLLRFAVREEFSHEGVAEQMMAKLCAKCTPEKRARIVYEVSENDVELQKWLKTQGFVYVKTLHDYFELDHSDAYVFEWNCKNHDPKKNIFEEISSETCHL
jgi:ribosomal protein S18 acetylase RimI-like enzyme